jgi:hypothetical protein
MATVYLAADIRHDRKVALKLLSPEGRSKRPAQRDALLRDGSQQYMARPV